MFRKRKSNFVEVEVDVEVDVPAGKTWNNVVGVEGVLE